MKAFVRRQIEKLARVFLGAMPPELVERAVEKTLSMSALDVAIDMATGNQVEGDYLEFGVYRGNSFVRAYHRVVANENQYELAKGTRFFAFDSFQGLPVSTDAERPTQYDAGAYAATEQQFNDNLRRHRVDLTRVRVIKKWFDQLGEAEKMKHRMKSAAVVYIDCDIYESTAAALRFVKDLLVEGSVIVFDDFYRHKASKHHGVRRAWEEFVAANPQMEATLVHQYRRVAFAINARVSTTRVIDNATS